jgi:murein DD-endopeptidase MepM/ murein hydrolase activator NlpD
MTIKEWWLSLKSKPIGDIIKHKHRFVVMDTDTFKEKLSFQLSGINLFVTIGITIIVLIILTTVLIAFTPLREFIPGYTDTKMIEQTYANAKKIDSLEVQMENQEWMISTMQSLLRGDELGSEVEEVHKDSSATLQQLAAIYRRSKEDSLLRLDVEKEDNRYEVKQEQQIAMANDMTPAVTHLFFAPLKGQIIEPFGSNNSGVDIAGNVGQPVNAAYSGTVIFAGFTAGEGHLIALQHPGNVVTVYQNNSSLLKRRGDAVRAGEPIAYVGPSDQSHTMPYLHFEIWINGTAVNPEEYISF